jgi:molybdopterin synthase catalytic subunit
MKRKPKNIFIQGAIQAAKISESVQKHASQTEIGAHAIFLGQVRADEKKEGTVTAIEYTAYEEMAIEKAHEIREAVFAKYPVTCIHIYHSLGQVNAGEICFFVFTSAPHRRETIDACNEIVERIKAELPVWGRELLGKNKHVWKKNT